MELCICELIVIVSIASFSRLGLDKLEVFISVFTVSDCLDTVALEGFGLTLLCLLTLIFDNFPLRDWPLGLHGIIIVAVPGMVDGCLVFPGEIPGHTVCSQLF